MTIRKDMLKALAAARPILADRADAIVSYILQQLNIDGGFRGKAGVSDLYYSVFAVEILRSLQAKIPVQKHLKYLSKFDNQPPTDLVHLASLIRLKANLAEITDRPISDNVKDNVLSKLEKFKTRDGGFNTSAETEDANAYGCFLSSGIYQELEINLSQIEKERIINCIQNLQMPDGGYTNDINVPISSIPGTAAALVTMYYLQDHRLAEIADLLKKKMHSKGGFTIVHYENDLMMPDLLSTATALHALAVCGIDLSDIKQQCLNYVQSLWRDEGGFTSCTDDDAIDCEYTYYGLLSLGHLC
jgi:prenyltransferase beta subunit